MLPVFLWSEPENTCRWIYMSGRFIMYSHFSPAHLHTCTPPPRRTRLRTSRLLVLPTVSLMTLARRYTTLYSNADPRLILERVSRAMACLGVHCQTKPLKHRVQAKASGPTGEVDFTVQVCVRPGNLFLMREAVCVCLL